MNEISSSISVRNQPEQNYLYVKFTSLLQIRRNQNTHTRIVTPAKLI